MEKEDDSIEDINQLVKSIGEAGINLEKSYKNKDAIGFNKSKKFIMQVHEGDSESEEIVVSNKDVFLELKQIISKEDKIVQEIMFLEQNLKKTDEEGRKIIKSQIKTLKDLLKEENKKLVGIVKNLNVTQPLKKQEKIGIKKIVPIMKEKTWKEKFIEKFSFLGKQRFLGLEKETIKRVGKKDKKILKKKDEKPSWYIKKSNKIFAEFSENLAKKSFFMEFKRALTKSNLQFVPKTYISIALFTILLATIGAVFLFIFFLFFNFGSKLPIITFATDSLGTRFLKVLWILFAVPIGTALVMYFYPALEKKSNEGKINAELPFATIHMSAISGSLVDPTKIFNIIISTKEYPYISREFTKLLNQINIYGQDLVTALRELSFSTASSKLSELLNGLSTTINSGGELSEFFEKRAESLLFDYRIEREKQTKAAETFMDIYISVVVASPMILMLLLMMMKISGMGISFSSAMISLIMVLGVSVINVMFLVFLHLKQPSK